MTIEVVCLGIILLAGIFIVYKIYLQNKINSQGNKNKPNLFVPKDDNSLFFLPISEKRKLKEDLFQIRKANRALLLFYLCLLAICIITLIYFPFDVLKAFK